MVVKHIIKKELFSYFYSPIAYIYVLFFLVINHWYFFKNLFIYNQASMYSFFSVACYFLLLLISSISMRVWSEEKKSGTLLYLFSLPVSYGQLILGKYLASLIFLSLIIFATLPFVFVVFYVGSPDIGIIFSSYFGLFLLGAVFLAIGFFCSSITENQIISFLISLIICFVTFIMNSSLFIYSFPTVMHPYLNYFSLSGHYDFFVNGLINGVSILYMFSFIILFLSLNYFVFLTRSD